MRIPKLLFFSIIIPIIHSLNTNCPYSSCGKFISIQFPFKLESQQPKICSDYINLTCNSQNITILNLPFSGEFYIHDIYYSSKMIELFDPENCLPKRIMNLNLSSSPFCAIQYQNYTFYNCPITNRLFYDGFYQIHCLSIYPNATVASSLVSPEDMMQLYGCSVNTTVKFPVSWFGEFDNLGIFHNLKLNWDVPGCKDCEEYRPIDKAGVLLTFLGIACLLHLMKLIVRSCHRSHRVLQCCDKPPEIQSLGYPDAITPPHTPRDTTTVLLYRRHDHHR